MLDPIKMLAFGQTKRDRYLQEAESTWLIKAAKDRRPMLGARLIQRIGQWFLLLGQRMQVAVHLACGEIAARERTISPGDPARVEQSD